MTGLLEVENIVYIQELVNVPLGTKDGKALIPESFLDNIEIIKIFFIKNVLYTVRISYKKRLIKIVDERVLKEKFNSCLFKEHFLISKNVLVNI